MRTTRIVLPYIRQELQIRGMRFGRVAGDGQDERVERKLASEQLDLEQQTLHSLDGT